MISKALIDVQAERQRQIDYEGFTLSRDDTYEYGQLAGAAGCYARHVNARSWVFPIRPDDYQCEPVPVAWPWGASGWKPTSPRRDLVKAGALILAEIERIDRTEGIAAPAPCETNYGFELFAIRKLLGIPAELGTLDYIKAVEYVLPLPVVRNEVGMWTHPAYLAAFGGCETVPTGIIKGWLEGNDLVSKTVVFAPSDTGDISWDDVAAWEPEAPEGEGWFIGSIHESEDDGVVCVWLRKTK